MHCTDADSIQLQDPATSLSLSSDGRHLLVNVASEEQETQLWDLDEKRLLQKCASTLLHAWVWVTAVSPSFAGTAMVEKRDD